MQSRNRGVDLLKFLRLLWRTPVGDDFFDGGGEFRCERPERRSHEFNRAHEVARVPDVSSAGEHFGSYILWRAVMPRPKGEIWRVVNPAQFIAEFDPAQVLVGEPGRLSDE